MLRSESGHHISPAYMVLISTHREALSFFSTPEATLEHFERLDLKAPFTAWTRIIR